MHSFDLNLWGSTLSGSTLGVKNHAQPILDLENHSSELNLWMSALSGSTLGVNYLGVNSGGLLSRATDFGFESALITLWVYSLGVYSGGLLWGSTISGHRFWI